MFLKKLRMMVELDHQIMNTLQGDCRFFAMGVRICNIVLLFYLFLFYCRANMDVVDWVAICVGDLNTLKPGR